MLINFVYHFVFLPNKIEPIASIEFDWVRYSNLIELTKKFQFDYVRLLNQSNSNRTIGFDWFLVWFHSISYAGHISYLILIWTSFCPYLVQGPVLAIIYASCLSVLAFMGVRCQLIPSSILATNKRTLGISRSQKWLPRDRSMQSFMGNTGS